MNKTASNKRKNSLKNNENIIEKVTTALNVTNQRLADELGVSRAKVENWKYHDTPPDVDSLHGIIRLLVDRVNALSRLQDIVTRAKTQHAAKHQDDKAN